MTAERPRCVLDITRLILRADGGPLTGIDRVELAYLRALAQADPPAALAVRAGRRWLLLEGRHGGRIADWIDRSASLPPWGLAVRLRARQARNPALLSAIDGLAMRREGAAKLADLAGAACARGGAWISVGHANLDEPTLWSVRQAGLRPVVMIHDTIPIDHPEWSGAGAPARHAAAVASVARHADLVLCPSREAAAGFARHSGGVTAHVAALGVTAARADRNALPAGVAPDGDFFLALGTIEPRKNLGLLLDLWPGLAARHPAPHLFVVGRPGWQCDGLLDRMASLRQQGCLTHLPALPDEGVAWLMDGARALLWPSRAEGFGLPPAEAALRGLPVIAADLAVTREILGDYPLYLPPSDGDGWRQAILGLCGALRRKAPPPLPDWTAHFNLVFNLLG